MNSAYFQRVCWLANISTYFVPHPQHSSSAENWFSDQTFRDLPAWRFIRLAASLISAIFTIPMPALGLAAPVFSVDIPFGSKENIMNLYLWSPSRDTWFCGKVSDISSDSSGGWIYIYIYGISFLTFYSGIISDIFLTWATAGPQRRLRSGAHCDLALADGETHRL